MQNLEKIKVVHIGEDYSTIEVNGAEFETSKGLGLELKATLAKSTIGSVRVSNMESSRGREVPNQFDITTPEGRYFQSYASTIVFIPADREKIVLDEKNWNYSTTTGKYRNIFLGEDRKETEAKIKSGEYILANLN